MAQESEFDRVDGVRQSAAQRARNILEIADEKNEISRQASPEFSDAVKITSGLPFTMVIARAVFEAMDAILVSGRRSVSDTHRPRKIELGRWR